MTSELDIYRTAQILLDAYGIDAESYAKRRMGELLNEEDLKGGGVWLSVLHAIDVLRDREDAGPMH